MELSAVITLRDKLSAQMDKASKSVSAMTERVNESRDAISKIAETQNINISARSNLSEVVSAAKTSIASLQNTISQKELTLQTKIDMDGFENETINAKLSELGSYLEKNGGKVEEYSNKLAILKQKQAEFTNTTKGSVRLGVEQSIENLEKKLADIEAAKQQFAEWQQIRIDFNELEDARVELSTLERALENLNHTNVAVRAYMDFKTDALKQVYDIDEKLKSIGQRIIRPVVELKDQATEKISGIKTKATILAKEKFAPIISAVDKAKPVMTSVRSTLGEIAGTAAYPIIKAKDFASSTVESLSEKLRELGNQIVTPEVKLKKEQIKNDLKDISLKFADLGAKAGKAIAGATATITKGLVVSVGAASTVLGGIGAASINVGSQFEASMSQVAATMGMTAEEANYSNEEYAKLANVAKEMGASTKFSASEAGEALNYLALAGYDADKACAALPTILDLAAAGGMDLAAASDMVTDSMSALGIAATKDNLTSFGDQLAKTAQKSNTSVAQLGEAILTVGGTAKTLAGGTTELNTLLGIIADNGVKGAEGGTKLRNIMLSLQSPTDAAAKKLNSLGVSVYDAQGKMRPMNEILGDLNTSMGNMTDAAKQDTLSTIFNKADLKSVTALLSGTVAEVSDISTLLSEKYQINLEEGDLDTFSEMLKKSNGDLKVADSLMKDFGLSSEIANNVVGDLQKSIPRFDLLSGWVEDSNGAMGDMAETMNDNLQGRITEFKSAMEGAGIAIYEAFGSGNLKDLVYEASGWIGELTEATEEGGINGLVGAVGSVFTKAITKIASMSPQMIQAGVGIVGSLISGIKSNLPQIANGLTETGTVFIQGILQLIPELLLAGGDMVLEFSKGVAEQLPELLNSGTEAIVKLAQGIADGTPLMADVVVKIITILSSSAGQNLQPILDVALDVLMAFVQGFTQALPVLIPAVVQIITGLVTFIIENLPMIIQVAIQIVVALVQGFIQAFPQLAEGALQLVQVIWENITSSKWIQLGIDLVKGIGSGLIEGVKEIGGSIKEVAGSIVNKFKGFLGIHSPSTVMKAQVGFHVGAGVVEGLKETKTMINHEVQNMAANMKVTMGANLTDMQLPEMKLYEPYDPDVPRSPKEPQSFANGTKSYQELDIAQPINHSDISNSYSETTKNQKQMIKKYYIEKIIENVTVTGEGDEDRLAEKILAILADDIEETAENMGEEDFD